MATTTTMGSVLARGQAIFAVRPAASILCHLPRGTLPLSSLSPASKCFSAATRLGPLALRAPVRTSFVGFSQQRTIFGGGGNNSNSNSSNAQPNRNLLAHMEQQANNNPSSATAQNGFYQALLRANMPEILVERYNTGRYATNAATDQAYQKALERLGAAEVGAGGLGAMAGRIPAGNSNTMSSEQLQAIGQAVSAKTQGGNVSISRQGSGAKSEPLYVVVDESMGSTIFKWVRFFLVFGLVAYCSLVVFTLLIEATGVLKKVGGAKDAEAKPELQTTKFSDVQGCDEAKDELQELVDFLKSPDQFSTLGGKLPKGVLLVGPPGTGKTLLARAVAGEAGVPFFYMSGSEFDEVYVGVGAKRVRELFTNARAKSPAIIFIDELDAIGSKRHERDAAYAKQTLNQLLTELDGFSQDSGVIIIGATNFPESLDKALTRPGRFDRNVNVPLPDVRGRIAILKHHMRNIKFDPAVDAATIARGCPGFSGAELENVVNQAAVRASKLKQQKVTEADLVWAKDKIMMGAERRSAVIQQKDKVMTAYHEGGHALVALLTEDSTPLYKATIMPRGHALGITYMLPEMDQVSETKRQMMAQIDVAMGGKVAEELIYGADNVTTGASSDITNATRIAYSMVTRAGMSESLGNIDLANNYNKLSGETKKQIESEVRRLVEDGRKRAVDLLTKNREGLERLANALVEYETLNKEEIEKVVRGEKLTDKLKVDVSTPVKMPEPGSFLPPPPPPGVPVPGVGSGSPDPPSGGQVAGSP
ncbi:Mitochondrial inner membrane i-AAA protease supercomplex subunit [Fulvia fulva]|uniref:Mitochondrial inner membrane i-AAA protease supercomplex subunit n=1 Tax=Passalora fulva TaxID=5499 RepID=A0A9Q8P9B9_PASFU|nr:Mitochondrial inner membrane i-AAA protease supercomplex subunit [Fulvia fulva]KAK4624443.1 Mitochondrial inner membrane i-AAA protease supercomplex subunit [Fulvia fulva]KAK4625543.1 Mitochondrial inner membrane i-AAA protease supercomplex subunit [Fulvia fulva]UJO17998.1 Mitochondrial inner membrane i-AAA protease supercomplex subunit [Fulvia fulva]WPV14542.1 Mitochondrial inner membrane i-AAA protease supercomplex subunit [Fulvia fulva]WPV30010.1 Mitochondrial inner membrane i-AAA protea